jgi:hypothetical protein
MSGSMLNPAQVRCVGEALKTAREAEHIDITVRVAR